MCLAVPFLWFTTVSNVEAPRPIGRAPAIAPEVVSPGRTTPASCHAVLVVQLWCAGGAGWFRPGLDSALTLLVSRVLADHHDAAVATDHLALVTDGLDGGVDLHVSPFS